MDKYSHLGYVVWFGLIEIIASENGNNLTGKVLLSPAFLRRKLRTTPSKLREVLEYCRSRGRLLADCSQEKWELEIPKLLSMNDNYTKDLQAAGKKLAYLEEETRDKRKSKKKNTPLTPQGEDGQWETFWDAYPKHKAKVDAIKAWNQLEPDGVLLLKILDSLEKQKASETWRKDGGRYVPLPATWLRGKRWEDEPVEASGEVDHEELKEQMRKAK